MLERVTIGSPKRRGGSLAAIAFISAFASVGLGFLVGNRWVLPALNTAALYPFYINLISGHRRRQAVVLALLWALFLSQAMIVMTAAFPKRAEALTIKGPSYAAEMTDWIRTGDGKESTPREFFPEQARDFAVFCGLAVLTAGLGALFLGCVLMNYMNYYVAALVASSAHPVYTTFLAWPPYAVIRVVGYVVVATALTETFLGVATRYRAKWSEVAKYAAVGFALVASDVIIKILLAPAWGRILKWATGL